ATSPQCQSATRLLVERGSEGEDCLSRHGGKLPRHNVKVLIVFFIDRGSEGEDCLSRHGGLLLSRYGGKATSPLLKNGLI
ncbi:MAG TPA: hypothetical protein PLO79_08560, partial [Candidatus Marinimicrobia bacterium]|nr:hypothetical protein [Candidatus Neomarinimicrobiota bacterium]